MSAIQKQNGQMCAYKDCKNYFYISKDEKLHFFRFPKDHDMCKKWVQASGRHDLSTKDPLELYTKYRICSKDFIADMYMNVERKRLLPLAVPNEFLDKVHSILETISEPIASCSGYAVKRKRIEMENTGHKKIKVISDITIVPPIETDNVEPALPSPVATQTSLSLSLKSPRKEKYKHDILILTKENKNLKKQLCELQGQHNTEVTSTDFEYLCEKFLSPDISKFVKIQIQQMHKHYSGRRYTNEFKKFALSLYFTGPKCYRSLQNTFILPSVRVLQRFLESAKFCAGYNANFFKLLQLKVAEMDDKKCIICIDEMALKTNLFYNYGADEVVGLEDDGTRKTQLPASSVAVIMVRGIKSNWKQPLGYFFSATGLLAKDTIQIIHTFIVELFTIGLEVFGFSY